MEKPIVVDLILFGLFLKQFRLGASTMSWSKIFLSFVRSVSRSFLHSFVPSCLPLSLRFLRSFVLSFVIDKKCGRRVRPTRYTPARLSWHRYSILFPELRRGMHRRDVQTMWIMTLTFDLGHRDCRSYTFWYFVRVPIANFVVWPTRVRHTMWPWPWRSWRLDRLRAGA